MASRDHSRSPSTLSEGEIIESGSEMKATTSKPPLNGTSVDRPPRDSSSSTRRSPGSLRGSKSPRRRRSWTRSRSRSRSRSPYRDSKGSKRRRDDNYDGPHDRRPRHEPSSRRYGSRYDDRPHDRNAPPRRLKSYHDYDREDNYGESLQYTDDYDRRREKQPRTRSRSPYRDVRKPKQYDDPMPSAGGARTAGDTRWRSTTDQVVSERGKTPTGTREPVVGAETHKTQVQQVPPRRAHFADDADTHMADSTADAQPVEPMDEAAALEARRKRREAIKAKYRSQASPMHLRALQVPDGETDSSATGTEPTNASTHGSPSSPRLSSAPNTPSEQIGDALSDFTISKDADLVNSTAPTDATETDEPSAADYDPMLDTKQEREKASGAKSANGDVPSAAYDETQTTRQDILLPDTAPQQALPSTKAKDPYDMFAEDDDDDMFAEETTGEQPAHASATAVPQPQELDISMMDNWDDPEGYYNVRLGELINGRYHITQNLGRGMFSSVVRATDSVTETVVAIKIIRQNDTMRKAGMKEIDILEQLREADPEDKKHVIKFIRYFDHKGHLCMVFENLSMNLREVLKKFGRDVGLNLRAIRAYAQQMFLGLSLLRKCNILHADLKPDNLLVNEQRNVLKVCDLGSASTASENEITPYLVSRFYRAPEVILGIPYDFAIDVWSIGCTLFELYTGKILFTGRNNNQMLKSIMECRGKYPPKLLKRGSLSHMHFDDMLNFHSAEEDKLTGRPVTRILDFKKPTRDLKTRLMGQGTRGMSDTDAKDLTLFVDFLDRCLTLNPEKRCTPAEALKHPFLNRK